MAQLEESRRGKSKNHSTKKSLRVDLTPMVDLGFLLITFFILTTALSEPMVTNLIMPKDSGISTPIKESTVLTLTLKRNDEVGYYEGMIPKENLMKHTSFNNIRNIIRLKQKKVEHIFGNSNETVIIISPAKESSYKNFIDALDEIQINDIKHYFIVDAD